MLHAKDNRSGLVGEQKLAWLDGSAVDIQVLSDGRNFEPRRTSLTVDLFMEYGEVAGAKVSDFEVVDQISRGCNDLVEVSVDSVKLAAKWCQFLEIHARKAYGEYLEPDLVSARRLLSKIKSGAVKDFDKLRDIYRHGWKNLTTPKDLEDGLKVLESYGWARVEVMSPPAGRRFEVIRLHPGLRAV